MVPARAGSKTIPKKNIRLLGGKPLILHVLESIRKVSQKNNVIVSTDDHDVKEIVSEHAFIHDRSEENADDATTLDDVALEVAEFLKSRHDAEDDDIFITLQPTSPFITAETIKKAIEEQQNSGCDTVLTVTDDRKLRWTVIEGATRPLFQKRVNRQQMDPVFAETGGIISTSVGFLLKNGTRVGSNISLIEVDEKEGLDIDSFADWALAEYWVNKLRIFIRVDGGKNLGYGHLYRSIAIAQNIHSHDVYFVTKNSGEFSMGRSFLSQHHYPIIEVESNNHFLDLLDTLKPDIVINDILDTEKEYIEGLKKYGCFVVNFEDLGEGNLLADVVINDLYPDLFPQENHWYGVEHAILNPNFEMANARPEPGGDVGNILLAFGGTDPSGLTKKALKALIHIGYEGKVTVVIGPGYSNKEEVENVSGQLPGDSEIYQDVKNMAALMKKADLALTSAGRTVTELMTMGVPTIAMCQNMREMRHNHASSSFGVVNLGLGESVTPEVLGNHINMFLSDKQLRVDMYRRMRRAVQNRSNNTIVSKILSTYQRNKNTNN